MQPETENSSAVAGGSSVFKGWPRPFRSLANTLKMLATTAPGSNIQMTGMAARNAGSSHGITTVLAIASSSESRAATVTLTRQNAEVMLSASASVELATCGMRTCDTDWGTYQSNSTSPIASEYTPR